MKLPKRNAFLAKRSETYEEKLSETKRIFFLWFRETEAKQSETVSLRSKTFFKAKLDTLDRRREKGERRLEKGDKRCEKGDRRLEKGDRRCEKGDRMHEKGDMRREKGDIRNSKV